MAPITPPHAGTVGRLDRALRRAIGDAALVRVHAPVVLDEWSEPEPDVVVCRLDPYAYTRAHPRRADILLIDSDTTAGRYRVVAIARAGERLPTPIGGSVAVDDVLPAR